MGKKTIQDAAKTALGGGGEGSPPAGGGGGSGAGGGGGKPGAGPKFEARADGIYHRCARPSADGGEPSYYWRRICSPLEVVAKTRTGEGEDWGRLLSVTDDDGARHIWPMPMEYLGGDGGEYRRQLLRLGLRLEAGKAARDALHEYLSSAQPQARARCVDRVGWHGARFILPAVDESEALGGGDGEGVILQGANCSSLCAYGVAGTVDSWRVEVSALASGNSRLLLAFSTAFAAPLLALTGDEGGGFHLRGGSSTGKSTALVAAGSVWGGGGRGYVRQWRSTDNALEGLALAHNDGLLCLDELSQIQAPAAGQAAYMLSNGMGKARQAANGGARDVATWRTLFLSNGEIGLADKIAEAGGRMAAGMAVRVVDVRADAGAGAGLFEELHESPSAAVFAQRVKAAARAHYGAPGRAFVAALEKDVEGAREQVAEMRRAFIKDIAAPGMDGQVLRVLDRFALVGAAGELALDLGLVAWKRGEALGAAARCFRDWVGDRGGVGSAEAADAAERIRVFIAAHGEARFTPWEEVRHNRPTMHRAGYVKLRESEDEDAKACAPEYYFTSEAWKNEVMAGLDLRAVNLELAAAGVLPDGHSAKVFRVPAERDTRRLYRISKDFLRGGAGDGEA